MQNLPNNTNPPVSNLPDNITQQPPQQKQPQSFNQQTLQQQPVMNNPQVNTPQSPKPNINSANDYNNPLDDK
jgi:hypothetical protein